MPEPERRFSPARFWEEKVLKWEAGRYHRTSEDQSLLERMANRASDSLRFRLSVAGDLLAPFVAGKTVLEMGCGSGLVARRIMEAGAASYLGVDIAESAIQNARRLARVVGLPSMAKFQVGDVANAEVLPADVVFSLGLFDWLTDHELEAVFSATTNSNFLHAISERRWSASQFAHRLYCYLSYGFRTNGYVPRYLTVRHVANLYRTHGDKPLYVFRHPKLSFGVLITTLPVTDARAL